ncbi:unnamed protein product [Cladocopium goreaui]|uniref:Uncharacterized protein n=1 Tax=Cladocopium goreaui TaxID=2562237 RepID=A0A9P1D5F3_9DINO|nr:unnamed protein product [Cladocopium goreaui]
MRFLKQVGELLDSADEKATDTDLQSLTRQVGDTFGAKKAVEAVESAKRVTLNFGIVEGLSDLKNQIGSDLKELSSPSHHRPGDEAEDRLAALKERVAELRLKEVERNEGRDGLQKRLEEVELSIRQLQSQEAAQVPLHQETSADLEAMQIEFCEREAASRQREAAALEAQAANEHLMQQLEFWRDKAKQLLASLGLDAVPEDVEQQISKEEEDHFPSDAPVEGVDNDADESGGQLAEDHANLKQTIEDLEMTLAELMKGSEETIQRVDQQQHHERDLASQLAAAEALSLAQAREADALQRKLEELQQAQASQAAPVVETISPYRAASAELNQLRHEVESLRQRESELTQGNSALEVKAARLREKAAEDLERAVPSIDTTWWTWLDEPLLKLVTLLVKSTCLRRSFALHLLATDGTIAIRSGNTTRRFKASLAGSRNTEFLKLVERTEGAFQSGDDTAVEEVRRILADVRQQYDQVHLESERREAEIVKLREQIRVADRSHGYGADESSKKEDSCHAIDKQLQETTKALVEAKTSKKVYTHMCERITKEQALLKEKLLLMEAHLQRKSAESQRKVAVQERLVRKGAQCSQDLDILEQDVEHERVVREDALAKMALCLQAKIEAGERRNKFEEWRHEVALDAANEAFNASAGRLRKLYAVEKLAGNCLQKVTFEQVERSQNTEDGFQKIREVTGLADVMDIVHKFLNRDVEHEQLKSSVKEAEMRLDTLREQFERFKRDTDGITFDTDTSGKSRSIYLEVEDHEAKLNLCQKEHEQSRDKLQQSTLQVEHMKRWANRMGRSLSMFEDCVRVEKPSDLPVFYQQMQRAVDKFIAHIVQQISSGKVQRKNMSQVASKEYHEARRLLADKDFLKANCRVPASLDAGRPPSRQGQTGAPEEDAADVHQQERERCKKESNDRVADVMRKAEMQKKRGGLK